MKEKTHGTTVRLSQGTTLRAVLYLPNLTTTVFAAHHPHWTVATDRHGPAEPPRWLGVSIIYSPARITPSAGSEEWQSSSAPETLLDMFLIPELQREQRRGKETSTPVVDLERTIAVVRPGKETVREKALHYDLLIASPHNLDEGAPLENAPQYARAQGVTFVTPEGYVIDFKVQTEYFAAPRAARASSIPFQDDNENLRLTFGGSFAAEFRAALMNLELLTD